MVAVGLSDVSWSRASAAADAHSFFLHSAAYKSLHLPRETYRYRDNGRKSSASAAEACDKRSEHSDGGGGVDGS